MDTQLILRIVFWVVLGLIMGYLARAILPGKQKIGLIPTLIVGVIGSFVGGIVAYAINPAWVASAIEWQGLVAALVGSLVMLIIYCLIFRKNWR